MSVISVYKRFLSSTYRLRLKADAIYSIPVNHADWRFSYASVTLISELWQAWGRFCFDIIMESCRGTRLRDGTVVSQRIANNTRQRIAYEVAEYNRNRTPHLTRRFSYLSQEPTWGDVNMLLKVLPGLGVSNRNRLTMAFGISTQAPKHLQIVRNACFHMNNETMKKVKNIQPFYIGTLKKHPSELRAGLAKLGRCISEEDAL